ncbi:glycine cleavage system aminomethyltransferase GcvT [Rhodohalobacter sp. SW132]|uniref:glycine cleavage system aminomethyltransferase GcvT n=1 Tax=Rhodohalobacter sp. SW132 TaxID=2293433 RepID=UPI000E234EBC|nr:glycine cleavage system aminomethyltransferase GcvT [Rhodohalobacter sp. SW132]REL38747.1 glycine cleavage system aminomethyltransferase GcvT [Rhodohalobacter sp. SW132]
MSKKTVFYPKHKKAGAKLIDFGGFLMPVQYAGIKQEHHAVREKAGIFDVSHMGEFFVNGPNALPLIQKISINDASKLKPGKAQYTAMCYENGGIVDDLLVYMLNDESYMLVVNASNIEKDWDWITSQNDLNADIENRSDDIALIALQGPESANILSQITEEDLVNIGFYSFKTGIVAGEKDIIISATGYTGEKGFELYIDTRSADPLKIWDAILEAGTPHGLEPAGLGARDTLRLEMGFALYGNDITKDTHPLEARMGWLTKLEKDYFVGKDAILKAKDNGLHRKLMGFEINEPRKVPRAGYDLVNGDGDKIGYVTSGTQSITLGKGIGMGYIQLPYTEPGTEIHVVIRKDHVPATVTKPPFLKK